MKLSPVISAILLVTIPAVGTSAPITFNTALPVPEDHYIYRQQLQWLRSDDDPSGAQRDIRVLAAVSVLAYGINHKLAIFGVLPYSDKSLEVTPAAMRIERDNRGVGDVTGFARYTLWQHDIKGRTSRLAAFGGLTAPTGDDDESDRHGRLPPSLQNGTGAWDWFGGVVASHQSLGYQVDGQLSYRNNREANNFEAGDELRLDLSWQHRLWPRELGSGVPGFLYGVLELNALHQEKNRINGDRDDNSGGTTLWLSPGLQYVTKRWVAEAVVQKPVAQKLNGNALENDLRVTTSFRINF